MKLFNILSLLTVSGLAAASPAFADKTEGVDAETSRLFLRGLAEDNNSTEFYDDCASVMDTICDMDDASVFCSIVSNVTEDTPELGISLEENDYTIFVPTDAAFALVADTLKDLSAAEVSRIVFFHFHEGSMLTYDELNCGGKLLSLSNDGRIDDSRTKCTKDGKYQKGTGNERWGSLPRISSIDYMACTAVIHTIDHVMFPVYLSQFG